MEHTIENGVLRVRIDSLGAQLMSIQKEGTEYLWQGNPQYWERRARCCFLSWAGFRRIDISIREKATL